MRGRENLPARHFNLPARLSNFRIRLAAAAIVLLIVIAVALVLVAHYWPFTQPAVTQALERSLSGKVRIAGFHRLYFPTPGCVADGVAVLTGSGVQGSQILVMVHRLTIETGFLDMFRDTIREVRAEGLRVVVPSGTGLFSGKRQRQPPNSRRRVNKLVADGAILDFERSAKKERDKTVDAAPLRFELSRLTLLQRKQDSTIEFHTILLNPQPPGEIVAEGSFGPWKAEDPKGTPVSGSYRFEHAKLDAFKGIGGTLSSEGRFNGNLGQIDIEGSTATPDFEVKHARHPVRLNTRFKAHVDGSNGDTTLESVNAELQDTGISSEASIKHRRGDGKLTSLHAAGKGRIQDLLRLFSRDNPPAMSGAIDFKAAVTLPPGPQPFLRRITVMGDFAIDGVRFAKSSTQTNVNDLSARAQGKKVKQPGDAPLASGTLKGQVVLRNGVATFSGLTFEEPGASAHLNGTYNLLNDRVNLQGTLDTRASLSHSAKGIKAILLKPLDPIFKKKSAGASVGVKLGGTYDKPTFGIDLDAHK